MVSGIYLVNFNANKTSFGEGVVVVKDGSINGGDTSYLYRGKFYNYGDDVRASIEVRHYRGPLNSVMGPLKQFNLILSGKILGDNFQVSGGIENIPNISITITGSKIADLL